MLWNPVIANTLALCLDDGTVAIYVLKDNSFEYFSIDNSEGARYCESDLFNSWSVFYRAIQFQVRFVESQRQANRDCFSKWQTGTV